MGIGIWELVVLLAIAVVLFGTKKLRTLGSDLGGAIRGFRTAMNEPELPTTKHEAKGEVSENEPNSGQHPPAN